MSWLQDLSEFIKRLISVEQKVDQNAEEIKALRQDLKILTEFTQRVAYIVKRNQEQMEDKEERLILGLKLELLNLENQFKKTSFLREENQTVRMAEQLASISRLYSNQKISKKVSRELSKHILAKHVEADLESAVMSLIIDPNFQDALNKASHSLTESKSFGASSSESEK
jgi:hypothetical protein